VTAEPAFGELLRPHATGDELVRLVRYAELLERWSRRHNLVSWRSRDELVRRHLVDALAGRELLAAGRGALLDVGSGAGLPGIPLLAARPAWHGVLLEPRQKRWAFLRLVVRELGLTATVERLRYQDLGADAGGPFDVVTARAVGRSEELLEWAAPRLTEGGRVVIWSTEDDEARLRSVSGWRVLSSPLPSLTRGRLVQLVPCFT
jgi:16S rRNA (guanine527-N7)-methyltransferase